MAELRDEYLALRFAAGPLLVWTLSHIVFESVAFDLDAVGAQVARLFEARGSGMPVAPALEAGTRILWAASLLAFVVVALAVIAYSVWLLHTRLSRRARRLYVGLALALCAASLAYAVASSGLRNAFSMIYYLTHDALHACACYGASELRTIDVAVMSLNVLAAVVPPLALGHPPAPAARRDDRPGPRGSHRRDALGNRGRAVRRMSRGPAQRTPRVAS